MDNEENEIGVRCIAAVILDYQNAAKYAFSVSVPSNRMTEERVSQLAEHVLDMKKELFIRFGIKVTIAKH
jgi:DNA-binding IclR family transcriptional regulator